MTKKKKKEKSIPHELVNRNIKDKTEMEREKNVSCLVELSWVEYIQNQINWCV